MSRRRYRRRRRSTLQQFRALPPAGKVFVVAGAVAFAVIAAVAGANSKPPAPAPAVPGITVAPVSTYEPPAYTPAAVPTADGSLPAGTSGGGDVRLPLPHVYACVGRHVRICS